MLVFPRFSRPGRECVIFSWLSMTVGTLEYSSAFTFHIVVLNWISVSKCAFSNSVFIFNTKLYEVNMPLVARKVASRMKTLIWHNETTLPTWWLGKSRTATTRILVVLPEVRPPPRVKGSIWNYTTTSCCQHSGSVWTRANTIVIYDCVRL